MKKRILSLLLALAMLCALFPTLSVPAAAASRMNPTITDGILSWDPLDGAARYSIWWSIDGWEDSYTSRESDMVTTTSYKLQEVMDSEISAYSGTYTISVYAYRANGILIGEESIQFEYSPNAPQLRAPNSWFDGTTVQWGAVEHAESYRYVVWPGTSPTAFYPMEYTKYGVIKGTSVDLSEFIEPDLYYRVVVSARSPKGSIYKYSKPGETGTFLGADLIAGFNEHTIETCSAYVAPPMAGGYPGTEVVGNNPLRYNATGIAYHFLNSDGTTGAQMTKNDHFEKGKTYQVWVRLTGTNGWNMADTTRAYINGNLAVSHGVSMGGDCWYSVNMVAGDPVAVTVTAPVPGEHPVFSGTANPSNYQVTAVTFNRLLGENGEYSEVQENDTFLPGENYRVRVRLTGKGTTVISEGTPATINGLVAESEGVSMGGDAWYYVDLTATEAPVCTATVSRPMPGQHPVSRGLSGDPDVFTVAMVQYAPVKSDGSLGAALKETDVFTPNQVYRVVLVLWPVGGWEFSKDTKVTVNGIEATCLLAISGNGMYYVDMKCENPFVDVHESDFFFNPVMWAVGHLPQVTAGVDATHFGPNNNCTREQIVTFLWAANGKPEPEGTGSGFSDVPADAWYYKPVMWAVENKVTSGFSDGSFGVGQPCTRAQAMTFLWASKGKPAPSSMNSPFSDVSSGDWFCKAILWAAENGVTAGIGNGLFGVNNTCTRAQIITFLYKAYN